MNVLIKPFKVELISCTPETDLVQVFIDSRPTRLWWGDEDKKTVQTDKGEIILVGEYIKKLIDFDLSLSYFQNFSFRIQSSLIVRDYFYSFNTLGRWAYTHREGLPDYLSASNEVYSDQDFKDFKKYHENILRYNNDEIDYDTARQSMPLSSSTSWDISLSGKMLARILGQMFHDFGQCEMTRIIWASFASIPEVKDWLSLIDAYNYDNITKYYHKPSIQAVVGPTLYAQIVRHEGVEVTGLSQFMRSYLFDSNPNRTCTAPIHIQISVSDERWKEILRTRTAWFSQTDNWDDINSWSVFLKQILAGDINQDYHYLKYFNQDGTFNPSSIGAYQIDANLRVRKGKVPYFPDAFALESRTILLERIAQRGMNPLLKDYLQIFDRGYVKDNPNNELRKQWEELQQEDK